jgi:diguanylate cyclase (GGDEF)-like protein
VPDDQQQDESGQQQPRRPSDTDPNRRDNLQRDSTSSDMDPLTQTSRLSYDELVRSATKSCPRVVIVEGTRLGAIFEIGDAPLTIGRDPFNVLVLDEVGVSRRHCTLERRVDRVVMTDLGSKNGTFVNKEQVAEVQLNDGDIVFLGATTLKFLADDNVEHSYYQYLHEISVEDPLTRIPNRRYFDEFVRCELARARRYNRALSLLMCDVDHFKRVNDTFGHLCGDAVLRELAQVMGTRLRRSEFLARYGGEEFVMVLPETDQAGAATVAESLRSIVETHEFCCGDDTIPVTVSIGGATWQPSMVQPSDLVGAADGCLYEAKRSGRNRVVFL